MKIRQDAWSEENDLLLAETVLRHVREGSTQLKAFEEIGDKLDRTSAACGFRWNAVVRKQYEKALGLAKKQRKQRFRLIDQQAKKQELHIVIDDTIPEEKEAIPLEQPALTMSHVIEFLQKFDRTGLEYDTLLHELETSKQEALNWEMKYRQIEQKMQTIQEDYEALMKIMDRARKMVIFGDSDEKSAAFRMEQNGNLERIAD